MQPQEEIANAIRTEKTPEGIAMTVNYEQHTFEGEWKEFIYYTPEYLNLQQVIDLFGASTVLACFNQNIAARISTSVKNKLPKNLPPDKLRIEKQRVIAEQQGILLSKADALAWRPNVKGETPSRINNEIKKAIANKDFALVKELSDRLVAAIARESALATNG